MKDSSGAALPKKVDLTFTTGDAPAGDIQINGGAAYVTSNDAATLNVVNNASATLMRVANSVADLGSAPFFNAGTRNWPLGSGDGTKTVYAQFFNTDKSLLFPVRLASIVRDTQPPTIQSASVPQYYNASNNASNLAIAAVTASDATSGVDTYTWSGAGVSFNTSPPYSAQSPAFTIAGPDGNYSVSITATDRAGNTSHEQKFAITKKTSIPAAPTEGVGSWSKLSPVTEQSPITWIWNASSNSDSPPDTILEKLDTESSWTSHTLADHSRVMTLGDGTHILSVVQVDFAGNQSSALNLQIIVTPVIPLDRQIANGNPPQLSWRNFGGGQEYTVHVRLEGASSDLYDVDVGTIPHYQVPNAYLAGTQFSWYVEWPGGRSPPAQAVDQYYHYSVR